MTRLTIRWDRISALLATFLLGTFVGRANGLPWYAEVAMVLLVMTNTVVMFW